MTASVHQSIWRLITCCVCLAVKRPSIFFVLKRKRWSRYWSRKMLPNRRNHRIIRGWWWSCKQQTEPHHWVSRMICAALKNATNGRWRTSKFSSRGVEKKCYTGKFLEGVTDCGRFSPVFPIIKRGWYAYRILDTFYEKHPIPGIYIIGQRRDSEFWIVPFCFGTYSFLHLILYSWTIT